uniref:Fe2OG dioxygenase domain-containing protein n=1 Tax=Chromera velia CCMP2878 TaxID=1169474 RepID=A0A0G4GKN1_9ALVE|eukprot:Cvel_22323.t1-p1 / transcript=Cvel_22323.t1 / gene=Cvel_22323 / organism=Chromera_velia_CCMP2878 / gene_product=hypothetical protein / transcript_product=hypothetical protein / location=Cvel_scaffold2183:11473-12855(-) / protein_length=461 / sequence_SO=supercontig / SO=protein_coding / is_pseudo=false
MDADVSLPVVDFDDPSHVEVLSRAVPPSGPGFFYLKMQRPEVSALAEEALQLSREFFKLPLEEKQRLQNGKKSWYWVREKVFQTTGAETARERETVDSERAADPESDSDTHNRLMLIPSSGPGYRGMSEDANFSGDLRESYNLAYPFPLLPGPPRHPSETSEVDCGTGVNLWPRADMCISASPEWCEKFQSKTAEYFSVCFETATRLRRKLSSDSCLGPFLGSEAEAASAFEGTTTLLGFTHYTFEESIFTQSAETEGAEQSGPDNASKFGCNQTGQGRAFGIRPHQDDGLCTLLYTDGKPGLEYAAGVWNNATGAVESDLSLYSGQMCRDDAQFSPSICWLPVPFKEGCWIVNLGTDLFRWSEMKANAARERETGGNRQKEALSCQEVEGQTEETVFEGRRCKATLHRVVPMRAAGGERFSMPFFFEPSLGVRDPVSPFTRRWEYLVTDASGGIILDRLE